MKIKARTGTTHGNCSGSYVTYFQRDEVERAGAHGNSRAVLAYHSNESIRFNCMNPSSTNSSYFFCDSFMAYHNNQPFNNNHLRPCPMLENPEKLQQMVHETGAKSTDLQSPESVEHLCGKCEHYAKEWRTKADELWGKK